MNQRDITAQSQVQLKWTKNTARQLQIYQQWLSVLSQSLCVYSKNMETLLCSYKVSVAGDGDTLSAQLSPFSSLDRGISGISNKTIKRTQIRLVPGIAVGKTMAQAIVQAPTKAPAHVQSMRQQLRNMVSMGSEALPFLPVICVEDIQAALRAGLPYLPLYQLQTQGLDSAFLRRDLIENIHGKLNSESAQERMQAEYLHAC